MYFFRVIYVFTIISAISVNSFINVKLIQRYFKEKLTNYATIIGCMQNNEKINIARSLVFGNQSISLIDLKDITVNLFLLNLHYNHMSVVLDGDCDQIGIKYLLIQCGELKFFDVKHHWLILSLNADFSNIFREVELYINADINVIYPENINSSTKYIVEDVYNPASSKGGELKNTLLGFYLDKTGFVLKNGSKYEMRKNMTGVTLKSLIVLPVPFKGTLMDYLNSDKHPEINTFNRFHHRLLCPCVEYYNFTPNVSLSKSWGYLTENGSFDGLVGALERGLVDYGSSPLFVRTDRAQVMEYGRRTWTLRAAFVFRNPKTIYSVDIFIKPLSSSVWFSTSLSAIFIVIVLKFSQILERRIFGRGTEINWSYLVICSMAVFCQQGTTTTPIIYSGRITLLITLILSYLIYQFYSASIVSTLLMKPKTTIKSVEDILLSKMKAGCEDILYNRDYFLYTTDKISRELYFKKIVGKGNTSNFLAPADGLNLVKDGGYAFHVELATAYPIIENTFSENSMCELREVQMYRTQPMHSNLQKHSPFRDMFDTCLQRLAENGILHRELNTWHPKKPTCFQSSTMLTNLGLQYFYPLLTLLFFGIALSLLILMFELYLNIRHKIHESQKIVRLHPLAN